MVARIACRSLRQQIRVCFLSKLLQLSGFDLTWHDNLFVQFRYPMTTAIPEGSNVLRSDRRIDWIHKLKDPQSCPTTAPSANLCGCESKYSTYCITQYHSPNPLTLGGCNFYVAIARALIDSNQVSIHTNTYRMIERAPSLRPRLFFLEHNNL